MIYNGNESSKYTATFAHREDVDVFSKGGTPMRKWFCCIFPQHSSDETEPLGTETVKVEEYLLVEGKGASAQVSASKLSEDDCSAQEEVVINGSPTSTLEWPPQVYMCTKGESEDSSDVHMIHDDYVKLVNTEECFDEAVGRSLNVKQGVSPGDVHERSMPWLASIDQDVWMASPHEMETISEGCHLVQKLEKEKCLSGYLMEHNGSTQEEDQVEVSTHLEQDLSDSDDHTTEGSCLEQKTDLEPGKEQLQMESYNVSDKGSTDGIENVLDPKRNLKVEVPDEELEALDSACQVEQQDTLGSEQLQSKSNKAVEEQATALVPGGENKVAARTPENTKGAQPQVFKDGDITPTATTECSPKELVPDMVQSYGSFDFSYSSSEDMTGLGTQQSKLASIGEESLLLKEAPSCSKAEATAGTSSFNVLLAVSWVAVSLFALQGHELYEKYC
eukprot:Nitzschia sp. Nitz4//scaffold30_size153850//123194//124534//NITZ4_002792-RA/size153850-processed-gene-0.20-mRNA-1//1//CDS//3329547306//8687//frame0